MGCNEEPTSSDDGVSNNNSTNSTLETSNISDIVGSIDEYFHDFDEISTPYIDSKFNRYSGLSIINPLSFDEDSDTLNYSSVTDYILSFNIQDNEHDDWDDFIDSNGNGIYDDGDELVEYELTPSMTEFTLFDETNDGTCFIGSCSDGVSITKEDCCLNNSWFYCDGEEDHNDDNIDDNFETLEDCQNNVDPELCNPALCARSNSAVIELEEPECSLAAGDCDDDEKSYWFLECVDGTSSGNWTPDIVFDKNENGLYEYEEWVDLNGNGDIWDDCPDLNYDQQLTGGSFPQIYRSEEVIFNHSYGDVLKLEWNDDNDRYMVVSVPGSCGQLSHIEYLGDANNISNPAVYPDLILNDPTDTGVSSADCSCLEATFIPLDSNNPESTGTCMFTSSQCDLRGGVFISDYETDQNTSDEYGVCKLIAEVYENVYDSTAYITQINVNDVYGFHYTDTNNNSVWDEGEQFEVGESGYGQYYFDQTELVRVDSVYSTSVQTFYHTFRYPRKIVQEDSLMYWVSTDCNDNGQWDDAEPFNDIGNGVYDLGEEFIDELNGVYDIGEDYVDANGNNTYDEGEEFVDGNGQWDEGEQFFDGPNGVYDPGEDFIDSAQNGIWDEGELFTDALNGVYDEGEEFEDTIGDGLCDEEVEPFVDIGNGVYDIGEVLVFAGGNGVWDEGEEFIDKGNGVYDEGIETLDSENGVWDEGESFVDALNGIYDFGEDFVDTQNGVWDEGEEWVDLDGSYTLGEDFTDINSSGVWDAYCSQQDLGYDSNFNNKWACENAGHEWLDEPYVDGNGVYDEGESFTDGNGIWDEGEDFTDALNGIYDGPEYYDDINESGIHDYFCQDGISWNSNFSNQIDCEFNGHQWVLEVFVDINGNGSWDEGEAFDESVTNIVPEVAEEFIDAMNGVYDIGETFSDMNGNGYRDYYCTNGQWPNSMSYCMHFGGNWELESFTDALNGVYDEGEEFTDTNLNGVWDDDNFNDLGNGQYDQGENFIDLPMDTYTAGDPFIDLGNGSCDTSDNSLDLWVDLGNGVWDEGEDFTDALNGVYDEGEEFVDNLLNGIWDEGEEFIDGGDGDWNVGESYTDLGNGVWDPAEPFFNFYGNTNLPDESGTINQYLSGDPFLDRNCNEKWDDAERRSDDTNPFTLEECDAINGTWIDAGEYFFCDMGNGQWDHAESFTDSYTGDFITEPNIYTEQYQEDDYLARKSDRAETLIASYNNNNWIVYNVLSDTTTVTPRWHSGDPYSMLSIVTEIKDKEKDVARIDSVTSVYSYKFVENMLADEVRDYSITKTTWYENDERQVNYHLYRKDDETQNIMKLTHQSYFVLPDVNASEINGPGYADYLVYNEYPSEETLFYTYGGMLRDGEFHETFSTVYSSDTFAEYDIHETYEVFYEPAEMSYGNGLYDIGEDFEDEKNGSYDLGEEFTDSNSNGIRDYYCKQEGQWNTYAATQLNIGNYDNEASCLAASHSWEEESFIDGNGIRDENEDFVDENIYIQDVFKVVRTKKTTMIGSGLEIEEQNTTWLAKGKGIVKDEINFRFNQNLLAGSGGDDYDGFYRLELKDCRHCNEPDNYRSAPGMFDNTMEVNFDELDTVDDFNDSYKKIRTYGIQQVPINFNGLE